MVLLVRNFNMNTFELDSENLGKPTNPDIRINPKVVSKTKPQAWEHNWEWFYNYLWAIAEAEKLGKKLPNATQLEELEKSGYSPKELLWYNFKKTKIYSIRYSIRYYLSPYSSDIPHAYHGFFTVNGQDIATSKYHSCGFLVRCIKS